MDDTKNPDLTTPMSQAVLEKYRLGEDDEAMEPMVLDNGDGTPVGRIEDGDYVIFYDIRGEREVELTEAFVNPDFHEFEIPKGMKTRWATMIEYDPKLDVAVAYPTLEKLSNTLCDVVSRAGLKQAKVVETEKAVHLGFSAEEVVTTVSDQVRQFQWQSQGAESDRNS
jgi:2,3-bisphosphoglycerate-independent phosphoglycerate mutase